MSVRLRAVMKRKLGDDVGEDEAPGPGPNKSPRMQLTEDEDNVEGKEDLPGFKTASGKFVPVSKAAIQKAKTLFVDLDKSIEMEKLGELADGDVKSQEDQVVSSPIRPVIGERNLMTVMGRRKPGGFKAPSRIIPVPVVPVVPVPAPVETLDSDMTQEVLDCIQALLDDDDSNDF